jgi:hypothetical protein
MTWTYKNVTVFPAPLNGSGIRWTANCGVGYSLRADSKSEMRKLINALPNEE